MKNMKIAVLEPSSSMFAGKNVFTNVGSEKIKRRPSQVDRAIHRLYTEPRQVFSNRLADHIFKRTYWLLRGIQFRIFYKNEELDTEEVLESWDLGVKPPPLEVLAKNSHFDSKWLKYMYARFKNECPSGRMKEPEFKALLESIMPNNKGTDQYIARLFKAFSEEDNKSVTFQNLIECLSLLHPETAESRAKWTVRLITGSTTTHFTFPEFLSFTKSVFALNNCREEGNNRSPLHRESATQRAETIFKELDLDGDGVVTEEDMVRFYMVCFIILPVLSYSVQEEMHRPDDQTSSCSSLYRTPIKAFPGF